MKFEHKALLFGGVAGALLGVAAGFLYYKANEEQYFAVQEGRAEEMTKIAPREALGVGLALITLLRQIVVMGQRD